MTTKLCEHCGGTGHRQVGPIEAFEDELRARGVLFLVEGAIHTGDPEASTWDVVTYHRQGPTLSVAFGDVLDDEAAQAERIERFREMLPRFGGWESLVPG